MIGKELKKRILSSVILIPVSFFFIIQGSLTFIFFISLIFLLSSFEWFRMTKNKDLLRIFGLFFLFLSFFSTVYLRQNIGLNFFIFLIIVCMFTDIGGYIFGKTFKGPKLTKVSPKKTFKNSKLQINLALNYGSKLELISAFKKIGKYKVKINEKNLEKNLQTNGIPDPDILIRTGNTKRLSNFYYGN